MPRLSRKLQPCLLGSLSVLLAAFLAALFVPKSFALAAFGDSLQLGLIVATAFLTLHNALHTHSLRTRIFWLLMFTGSLLWAISTSVWSVYELWFNRPVPDVAIVDILLFVKVVPLAAAIAIAPDQRRDQSFRAFGLLDVFVLMVYSFYLFAMGVFAYRLLPNARPAYDFYFNLADGIGNQVLVVATGLAVLRARGYWRNLYRIYFFSAACYAFASNLSNFAIDAGRYYSGSLYDLPLVGSLLALICLALAGRHVPQEHLDAPSTHSGPPGTRATFFSEHLAMLVVLSTPVLGIWVLSDPSSPPQLRAFRMTVTFIALFVMTLLLSIKEDILAAGLFHSLQRLSETHIRIERFKSHLTQSEKLASLGKLVAQAANQIKTCMASTLQASSSLIARPDADTRIQNMAGKIGQYAQRTDALVENMLHFAQEMPLRLEPLDVKPLLESAIHLSRIAKLPLVHLEVIQEENCPPVRGDSGQLLQVFLHLISNAIDALEITGGGTFQITVRPAGSKLLLEFVDSGPGLQEPQRVFEPFYTTKPVGKGTGLGLSTCYGIIQQHEGEISCRNRPEGGAIFSILLPFASRHAEEEEAREGDLLAEGVQ